MQQSPNNLTCIRHGLATLCYERTRVQLEQSKYRHCPRDERHDAWQNELRQIEDRRAVLLSKQKSIIRLSHKYGVGVGGLCI